MNTKMTKLALALGAMALAGGAWAVDDTSTIGVTASIAAACSVGNGTTIAAGALTMITADGTKATATEDNVATNTFPAICTTGTTFPKFAYASENVAAGAFRLKGATTTTEFITYTLHQDATASLTAVSSATAIAHPSMAVDGASHALPLAVKVVAAAKSGQSVQAYADTITITSSFGVE